MPDFVVIGDVTQDNFFFIEDASVHEGELDLKYGSKIPVGKYAVSLGGNAANVSVGLARLGIQTALATTFGDDERGVWIKKKLMENNVDLGMCKNDPQIQSNISSIIVFGNERTILSYHGLENLEIDKVPDCQWLYLTSGSHYQKKPGVKIAYNPWLKDSKEKVTRVKQIWADTEVLIVNTEEAGALGVLGTKITVITDGANGAKVVDGQTPISKPVFPAQVVEVTGAGDAFSSGFLAALFYQKDLNTALDWGLKNSASVIQKIGAIEGLLCLKNI